MLAHDLKSTLTPTQRRQQVASILAKGVIRLRRTYPTRGFSHAQESSKESRKSLEFPGETRLSVVNGTHGFTPQGDGDDACA
jgi:hypothetical protein